MVQRIRRKYWKPHSLTWLSSFVPLIAGIFVATEPLHGLAAWVQAVNAMTGDMHPAVLINLGLVGIGLRGAVE